MNLSPLLTVQDYNKLIDFENIIFEFYPAGDLRDCLLLHSRQVCRKALDIADKTSLPLDREIIIPGAMLHDIGIFLCDAPGIYCRGSLDYIAHGIAGAALLREWGGRHNTDMEIFARICERHTGSGLTQKEIEVSNMPLPHRDFLPETCEEKLICFADKFFSKSGTMTEKSLKKIRCQMARFGEAPAARFEKLVSLFEC